jgi:DNA-directed RNA polymerase specialized sigma24 family protein
VFELSNEQRIVFLLFFTEGMDRYEIAEVTGLPACKISHHGVTGSLRWPWVKL